MGREQFNLKCFSLIAALIHPLVKYFTPVISLLIIVAVLIPGSSIPEVGFGGVDKFVHIGMFATWVIAMRLDFPRMAAWLAVALGLVFSIFTEVIQLFVEGRSLDFYDVVADSVGLLIGLLLARPVIRIIDRLFNRPPK
jgi:VanZ family protein